MSEAFEERSRSLEGRLEALSREAHASHGDGGGEEVQAQIARLAERLEEAEQLAHSSHGNRELEAMLEPFCAPLERRLREVEQASSAATAEVRAKLAALAEDDADLGQLLVAVTARLGKAEEGVAEVRLHSTEVGKAADAISQVVEGAASAASVAELNEFVETLQRGLTHEMERVASASSLAGLQAKVDELTAETASHIQRIRHQLEGIEPVHLKLAREISRLEQGLKEGTDELQSLRAGLRAAKDEEAELVGVSTFEGAKAPAELAQLSADRAYAAQEAHAPETNAAASPNSTDLSAVAEELVLFQARQQESNDSVEKILESFQQELRRLHESSAEVAPLERRLRELELSSSAATAEVHAKLASLEEDDAETGQLLLAEAAAVRAELARLAMDVKRLQERPAEGGSTTPQKAPSATAPTAAVPTKKLDPKDFIFSQRQSELLERTQGQIAGQQFILEELTDCEVLLLDHSAQVPIRARVPTARVPCKHSAAWPLRLCTCLVDLQQGRLWAVDRAEYKLAVGR
jgi:chromosome segregation ATPase